MSFRSFYKLCDHVCFCGAGEQTQSCIHSSHALGQLSIQPQPLPRLFFGWHPRIPPAITFGHACLALTSSPRQALGLSFLEDHAGNQKEHFLHTPRCSHAPPSSLPHAFLFIYRVKASCTFPIISQGRERQWWVNLACHL